MNDLTPITGQWYVRPDGLKFKVIDIDDDDGMIEVQDEDGTLDQIDVDDWSMIDLELVTQSEDATAPFDNVPFPDEADGGEPIDSNFSTEPIQVSNEERINSPVEDEEMDENE